MAVDVPLSAFELATCLTLPAAGPELPCSALAYLDCDHITFRLYVVSFGSTDSG
jgi:hypothetical protein